MTLHGILGRTEKKIEKKRDRRHFSEVNSNCSALLGGGSATRPGSASITLNTPLQTVFVVLKGGELQNHLRGGFGSTFGVPPDLGCPGEALGAILGALGVTLAALGAIFMVLGGTWEPPGVQDRKNT